MSLTGLSGLSGLSGIMGGGVTPLVAAVLARSPIAYWQMLETSGATMADSSGNGRNGAYGTSTQAPTLGQGQPPFVAPSFDGGDIANAYSASLAGAFVGAVGTVLLFGKVSAASVWSDSTARRAFQFQADGSNLVRIRRSGIGGAAGFTFDYTAGGTTKSVVYNAGLTTTDWMSLAITWDKNAGASGEVKAYYNGAQVGSTQTSLGTWAGSLAANDTNIGAADSGGAAGWSGWLSNCAVFATALSATQILAIHQVAGV